MILKAIACPLFLIICFDVFGCTCSSTPFNKAIKESEEIFFGRLVSIREINSNDETGVWAALFKVDKKWKGSNAGFVEVFQEGSSCDYPFNMLGKRYVVFATHSSFFYDFEEFEGKEEKPITFTGLTTYLCARNWSEYHHASTEMYTDMDDRLRLDEAFPNPVKTIPVRLDWLFISLCIVLPIVGFFIGLRLKKVNS